MKSAERMDRIAAFPPSRPAKGQKKNASGHLRWVRIRLRFKKMNLRAFRAHPPRCASPSGRICTRKPGSLSGGMDLRGLLFRGAAAEEKYGRCHVLLAPRVSQSVRLRQI